MSMNATSPLRYPGGKACLYAATVEILRANDLDKGHYAEAFAGGCGLALSLLYGGHVARIHVNDLDPAIHSFWTAVLSHTKDLVGLIRSATLSVDEWRRQRDVLRAGDRGDPLALGFSAFYLNRTNRSGVIKGAGVMGGYDQKGTDLIDCRFNREDLVRRIERVARYRGQIELTGMDALEFTRKCAELPSRSLVYADPPYYRKGPGLYTSYYRAEDHARLAAAMQRLRRPWMVTYDDVEEVRGLYHDRKTFSFDVRYTLNAKRKGGELMILSDRVAVPRIFDTRRVWWNGQLAEQSSEVEAGMAA
jgi:DNA adenine methylase